MSNEKIVGDTRCGHKVNEVTIDDNFITRAISRAFPQVQRIIQGVL